MALEQIFSCPRTLARLRSAPLGELLEGFAQWLIGHRFSRSTLRLHLAYLSHFNRYLGEQESTSRRLVSRQDVDDFRQVYPERSRHRGPLERHLHAMGWAISRFIAYLREQGAFREPPSKPPLYQPLLEEYGGWMRQRQVCEATLALREHSLSAWLQRLGPQAAVEGLERLDAEQVERLFLVQAQGMGQAARRSLQAALRTFLRFCRARGYIEAPLDEAVPTLRTYRLSTVPRAFSQEQAQRLLAAPDRHSAAGRRDYAILQLLYSYGVRSAQIRALRLHDIDWADNRIRFASCKNGKALALPLTEAVGEALLAYLRHGRPACSCAQVFVTARAPYRALRRSSNVSQVVRQAADKAGLQTSLRGAHALRHGLATRLLADGHSLKAIADVLGHRHLSTTFIYTKVDFAQLETVALDWPQEVGSC
jgi:site-specific recombinase XerD